MMNRMMLNHRIAISTVTQHEVLFEIAKNPGARRLKAAAEMLFPRLQILPWDSAAAAAYGTLRAQLASVGKPLAALDLLIAAHAISLDAILVTHDKAFHQVKSLRAVVDWATDLS